MSDYKNQKATKPKVEEVINDLLANEHKQAALDFVEYIKSHKITPSWASVNSWNFNYKGKRVGYIKIDRDGDWHLIIFSQYDRHLNELVTDEPEEIKKLVKNHIDANEPCGGCMPGLNRKLVNRELTNLCACTAVRMKNPDADSRGFAKRLFELRRDAIVNNRVPKCSYIKPADRT